MATLKFKNGDSWTEIKIGTSNLTWQNIYPVGAVYISYSSTAPGTLFGGTWSAMTGRFPYFNAGTGTGGSNTHTLTEAQLPTLEGKLNFHGPTARGTQLSGANGVFTSESKMSNSYLPGGTTSGAASYGQAIFSIGSGNSHNNMPAYQTLYAWRRTA